MSLFSQYSSGLHGLGSRTGASSSLGLQDSPEHLYSPNDRRPSEASVTTTASSTGSKASGHRGNMRKLQGFFGEEFPGRDSSESSLPTSYMGKDQRSRSYSHTRPTHRDRNYSNATDHTRDASPASSRPRTPVPAPEVVPFLYQDNNVSLTCVSESLLLFLPHLIFAASPSPCFVFFFSSSPYLSFCLSFPTLFSSSSLSYFTVPMSLPPFSQNGVSSSFCLLLDPLFFFVMGPPTIHEY